MAEDTVSAPPKRRSRCAARASRAAGPSERSRGGVRPSGWPGKRHGAAVGRQRRGAKPAAPISRTGPPPRRQPHRKLVAIGRVGHRFRGGAAVPGLVAWLAFDSNRQIEADAAREQQFVDTASQTVVNMFSYTQNNIDESVNRFVNGTSGPLRDMMSQSNNVDNLKAIFRDTNASSEAVINGAALEEDRRGRQERRGAGVGAGDRD